MSNGTQSNQDEMKKQADENRKILEGKVKRVNELSALIEKAHVDQIKAVEDQLLYHRELIKIKSEVMMQQLTSFQQENETLKKYIAKQDDEREKNIVVNRQSRNENVDSD